MKQIIKSTGVVALLVFCFAVGDAFAGKRLLDDFSGSYMSSQKWLYREFVREVSGGKLVSKLGNDSANGFFRNGTRFKNPEGITKIVCTITIVNVKTDTGTNPISFARIGGTFYNVESSGGRIGDVWAEVQIGDRGNGLEAFWEVEKALDEDFNTSDILGNGTLIPPGTLQIGIAYPVELEYTDEHDIIFRVAGQNLTFEDAGRQRPAVGNMKQLATGIDANGGSGVGYVSALFDDVYINDQGTPYDTFNTTTINTTRWIDQGWIREIANGKQRLSGRICNPSDGSGDLRVNVSSSSAKFDHRYIEAKMLIKGGSQIAPAHDAYTRLAGHYYNGSRGPGSGQSYNGYVGNVWVTNRLRRNPGNGQLEIAASAWRCDDVDCNTGESLIWQVFPIAVSYNTEYTLSIEFTDSKIIYKCNDLAPIIYNVLTPIYEPYDGWIGIQSRTWASPGQCGFIKTTIDDVYTYPTGPGAGIPLLILDQKSDN